MSNIETHWLTRYDPDDGEPYGDLCRCGIGLDHDVDGNLNNPDQIEKLTSTMRGEYCGHIFADGERCIFGPDHEVAYHLRPGGERGHA